MSDRVLPVGVLGKSVKVIKPVKPLSLLGLTTFSTFTGIASITSFTFYQTIQSGKSTLPIRSRNKTARHKVSINDDRPEQARPIDQILTPPNPTEEINP
jgi:hypothetical protein